MTAVNTLEDLEKNWKYCAIEFMGCWLLLKDKYERCLGKVQTQFGPALSFLVRGFSESIARESLANRNTMNVGISILRPNSDGIWHDNAYSGSGFPMGPIAILEPDKIVEIKFQADRSADHKC